jgi:hypothetical protein
VLRNPVVYWGVASFAFACELALAVGLGVVAWRLAHPSGVTIGIVAAVLVPTAFIGLWAVFMSPKAPRRLPAWPRATIAGVACVAVGSGLVAVGLHVPGIALIVSGPLLSAGQVAMGSGHPD